MPAPTVTECPVTEDGEYATTSFFPFTHPKMAVASGSAFGIGPTMISDAAISRPFGLLSSAPPGSSVSFAAFLGDEQVGTSSGDATTQADAAASVEILVKTSTVYHDSAVVEIAYRVRDAAGRSQVLSTDLSVTILLSEPSGVSTSGSCDTADPATGLGTCQFDVSFLLDVRHLRCVQQKE